MNSDTLNIATKLYPENRTGGLMICGINWGGDPLCDQEEEEKSFFSDDRVNKYPYRNRLVKWFGFWGHPLEKRPGREGVLERSIIQTNWLPDQSVSMNGRDIWAECIKYKDNFFYHLQELRPRLILFSSTTLLHVLNAPECIGMATQILGHASDPRYIKKEIIAHGKPLKKFTIGFQNFDRATIISVPHPRNSVSDAYIGAFKPEIGDAFNDFKLGLKDTHR